MYALCLFPVRVFCFALSFLYPIHARLEVDSFIVNETEQQGNTPLHEACIHGNLAILKYLLNYGADVDAKNAVDETPLHIACREGFTKLVEEILHHKPKTAEEFAEACVKNLNTAMHLAVESGDLKVVKALLCNEGNPSVQNDVNVMPIHIAAWQGNIKVANELLNHDSSCMSVPDKQHYSPLHYAARNNQVDMIKFLCGK